MQMKYAIIIHGTGGYPEENWFPWIKKKLEFAGYTVFVPQFPTPKNQDPEHWFPVFNKYKKYLDKDTVIIAHSGGCAFLLRILEVIHVKINVVVFVAPPIGVMPIKYYNADYPFIEKQFNWEKIRESSSHFMVFHSEDDPLICVGNGEKVAKELGVELLRLKNAGHFNTAAGYTEFPLLWEKLKELLGNVHE